jgi:hypothetical protein
MFSAPSTLLSCASQNNKTAWHGLPKGLRHVIRIHGRTVSEAHPVSEAKPKRTIPPARCMKTNAPVSWRTWSRHKHPALGQLSLSHSLQRFTPMLS